MIARRSPDARLSVRPVRLAASAIMSSPSRDRNPATGIPPHSARMGR